MRTNWDSGGKWTTPGVAAPHMARNVVARVCDLHDDHEVSVLGEHDPLLETFLNVRRNGLAVELDTHDVVSGCLEPLDRRQIRAVRFDDRALTRAEHGEFGEQHEPAPADGLTWLAPTDPRRCLFHLASPDGNTLFHVRAALVPSVRADQPLEVLAEIELASDQTLLDPFIWVSISPQLGAFSEGLFIGLRRLYAAQSTLGSRINADAEPTLIH